MAKMRLLLLGIFSIMTSSAHAYRIEARAETVTPVEPSQRQESSNAVEARPLNLGEPVSVSFFGDEGQILRTEFAEINTGAESQFVRVFVNNPDATVETATSDPSYIGAVAFYPVPTDGTFTSTLNLARASGGRVKSVTYVLAGAGDTGISISRSILSVE